MKDFNEGQVLLYAILAELFSAVRVPPAEAIPVLRKLADDAERVSGELKAKPSIGFAAPGNSTVN